MQSDYSDQNRQIVGKNGDWKSLGLPPARDITPDDACKKVNAADAKARMLKGETVLSPLGTKGRN